MAEMVPVICIDGPSASGKGTVAQRVADALGWHYLDSGALYRAVGWAARRSGTDLSDEAALARLAAGLDISFRDGDIQLAGESAGVEIRGEAAGEAASRVAALPAVRAALLQRQRDFRRPPGLVADGRDMGSVVFPDAACKVFLTASAEARADRRYKQLIDKGMCANFAALLEEIRRRDERDSARAAAPLVKTADALLLDTTALTIDQAVEAVLDYRRGGGNTGGRQGIQR